jgi:hypothetical protein
MKNIIITGSSNGFGLKAAKDFADIGNRVYATMRNPNGKNAEKKAELESYSTNIKVLDMDVTKDASVKEAMAIILAETGSVDVLINNAGIMYLGITEAFSVEQAKSQMETNYFGAIRVMQAVLPSMRSTGSGLIINTSCRHLFSELILQPNILEGYSQALRYGFTFWCGCSNGRARTFRNRFVGIVGELAAVPNAMGENFAQMLVNEVATFFRNLYCNQTCFGRIFTSIALRSFTFWCGCSNGRARTFRNRFVGIGTSSSS